MYVLNATQIAQADQATIATKGISSIDLMEHAATLCFQWLHNQLQGQKVKIQIFCGIGNNGGDGLVMARHLHQHGYSVDCYIVNFSKKRTPEFLANYNRLKKIGKWPTIINSIDEFPKITDENIVIDAIFGNGLTRNPIGFTKELIEYLNSTKAFKLSIDLPSGLFSNKSVSDTSAVIKANHTLTFQCPKLAFFIPENKTFVNTWEVLNIGLDENYIESLKPTTHFITKNKALSLYKPKEKWSHKGSYGHSLIIGGSFGKIGAVTLATKAALKIGSGLVSSYLPKCGYTIIQTSVPEAMAEVDDDKALKYFNFKTNPTVIGIGPGMGTLEKTALGFEKFIKENKTPLVIDADAINLISKNTELLNYLPKNTILTPHPKELERLIGNWENDYDKLSLASQFVKKHQLILVIKDAHTFIIDNNNTYINSTGNPALATGGTGDVLTGIITGLIAQGYQPINAVIFGVYLHGKTADIASKEIGYEAFTATSIFDYLPRAILDLFKDENFSSSSKNDENKSQKPNE